jgi:hypothetical protein
MSTQADSRSFGRIAERQAARRLQPTDAHLDARSALAQAMADLDEGVLSAALGRPHARRKIRWAINAVKRALPLLEEVSAQIEAAQ